ncbi:MAG: antitoxin [Rhodospirillales bacterium]|jgi:antitoxin VapB
MTRTTAKLFRHGRSQAVRLPKEFRLPGTEVRVSREGERIILEPIARSAADVAAVFADIDRLRAGADDLDRPVDPPVAPDPRVLFD